MTTPVLTRIKPSGSTFERSNYTIAIWLPTEVRLGCWPPQRV